MRSSVLTISALLGLWSGVAHASDLAEALNFAKEVMGDHIVEGYEEFVDWDKTEALALLLARDVTPGAAPQTYEYRKDGRQFNRDRGDDYYRKIYGKNEPRGGAGVVVGGSEAPYQTLGSVRLNYQALSSFITEASRSTGLPKALIDAVIRTESGYRPRVVSRAGAQGLMQLIPSTARRMGVVDPFDPRQNIMGGARYLRRLYDKFGSLKLAIAAYNAGPGAVRKHKGIPPYKETRRYVQVVLNRFKTSKVR